MPKKKGKRKVKKKEKRSKTKEKKTKKPTEKQLFELQIEGLKKLLEGAVEHYERLKEAVGEARGLLETEVDDREACVSHLKRALRANFERRTEIQEKLQTQQDMAELAERRALGKVAVSVRSSQASRCLFLQQKMELEGKLSLLEELRLERNSKRAHLRRLGEALEEHVTALLQKSRDEDMNQVDKLLRNREEFVRRCAEVRSDWRRAFQLRMPIHAEKQLEENVRLREVRDRTTKDLLQAQGKCRSLKNAQKFLELDEELQTADEEDIERRKTFQGRRLSALLRVQEELRDDGEQPTSKSSSSKRTKRKYSGRSDDLLRATVEKASETTRSESADAGQSEDRKAIERNDEQKSKSAETSDNGTVFRGFVERETSVAKCEDPVESKRRKDSEDVQALDGQESKRISVSELADATFGVAFLEQDGRPRKTPAPVDAIDQKMEIIRKTEIERCRIMDEWCEVNAILKDQEGYKASLERQIEENVEVNGAMMSAILRAGKIFQTRCGKLREERRADVDFELLHQMRLLLDMA